MKAKFALFLSLALATSLSSFAATYELIPSWKKIDETSDGQVYSYRAFYIDNKNQRVSICFASFLKNSRKLTLKCGGVVPLDWKLPKSNRVNSKIVGVFDIQEDNEKMPFGLWQIDESTGDFQFCIAGDIAVRNNCVLSHVP
jgi:hypothetical protein